MDRTHLCERCNLSSILRGPMFNRIPYMTIRKITSPYSYMTKIIIACIIILILVGQIIHRNNKDIPITEQSDLIVAPDGIQEGSTITATWIIQTDSNFPIHTHSLLLTNQSKIGLRSTTINLNNFLWEFEVQWTIHTINKWIPSIDINTLKNRTSEYIIKDNIYTYLKQQIIINLQNLVSIYSFSDANNIYIITDGLPIITIGYIDCKETTQQEQCEWYQSLINNSTTERFTSSLGITFYKVKEGVWTIFHNDEKIYILTSDSDDDIIDFSNTIDLIDGPYILEKYEKEIFASCVELDSISQISTEKSEQGVTISITGTNTKKETLGCTISIDLRNEMWITNVSLF